ncbi:MAG: type IV pilin N-terminal domain-containing protein [Archaeoglobaceae archaeon]
MKMDEKGVSPVIGVILMVAITVILAAVIASFVFGMGSTVKRTYNVAFTATKVSANEVAITFMGGPDVNYIQQCNSSIGGKSWGQGDVGKTETITASPGQIITVTCSFTDGTQQVVMTFTMPGAGTTQTTTTTYNYP